MIETISEKLATHIHENTNNSNSPSISVLKYSLIILVNTILIISLSLSIGILLGAFIETVIALISFSMLRQVSGGYHLKSSTLCATISTTMIVFIVGISKYLNQVDVIVLTTFSLILVLLYSPSNIEKQTRIPIKYHGYLKLISAAMVCINYIIVSEVIAVSFLIQTLLLIKFKKGGEHK
jgi:accessory gene regulator B